MHDLQNHLSPLKKALRNSQLIVVIGPEILTVQHPLRGECASGIPFYRLVAEELLKNHDLEPSLLDAPSSTWDLHRATAHILTHKTITTRTLRNEVCNLIEELSLDAQPTGVLLELARLKCLRLVLGLTPDSLFCKAAQAVQPELVIHRAGYSPTKDSESQWPSDIPTFQSIGKEQLYFYQLLGRADEHDDCGEFAIHEEDALEHLHRFREDSARTAKGLLGAIGNRSLLYLGCGLPDWMGRGLIRVLRDYRFDSADRPSDLFCTSLCDTSLLEFLHRFSKNFALLPASASEYVQEIAAICQSFATPAAPAVQAPLRTPAPSALGRKAPSIFISYASENAAAATLLSTQLAAMGFSDIWFDRQALIAGHNWSREIEEAIGRCDFFMPLLSRQADQRREGVFWQEWDSAIKRSRGIPDTFLLPIGIDDVPPSQAGYVRIFKTADTRVFYERHLLHVPGGQLNQQTQEQLQRVVADFQRAHQGVPA